MLLHVTPAHASSTCQEKFSTSLNQASKLAHLDTVKLPEKEKSMSSPTVKVVQDVLVRGKIMSCAAAAICWRGLLYG
jgi:hypothetical protein